MTSAATLHLVAADLARRIPEMARDSVTNNTVIIEAELRPVYKALIEERLRNAVLSGALEELKAEARDRAYEKDLKD